MTQIKTQETKDQFRIIGQGGYGCVFSPEMKCNTQTPGSPEYLSKIQKQSRQTQTEIRMSEIIQRKLPKHYQLYFSPIISHCPVNIAKIGKQTIDHCKPLLKSLSTIQKPSTTFISGKIKYIGKQTLGDRFQEIILSQSLKTYMKSIVNSQIYILRSLQKLGEMGIIHLDIKQNNIIYNSDQDIFIIIDFGLAIDATQLMEPKPTQQQFINSAELYKYDPWAIEIVLLSYIETKMRNEKISSSDVEELKRRCTLFCENNAALKIQDPIFTEYSRKKLKGDLHKWIDTFNGKTWEYAWNQLTANHKSWDNYSLAVTYLFEFQDSGILDNVKTKTVLKKYIELLKYIVLSMPNDRPDPTTTLQSLVEIFKHVDDKEYSHWIHTTEPKINKKYIQQNKKIRTLSQLQDDMDINKV